MSYLVLLRVDLGHEPLDLSPRQVGDGEEEDVLEVLVLEVPAVCQVEIPKKKICKIRFTLSNPFSKAKYLKNPLENKILLFKFSFKLYSRARHQEWLVPRHQPLESLELLLLRLLL